MVLLEVPVIVYPVIPAILSLDLSAPIASERFVQLRARPTTSAKGSDQKKKDDAIGFQIALPFVLNMERAEERVRRLHYRQSSAASGADGTPSSAASSGSSSSSTQGGSSSNKKSSSDSGALYTEDDSEGSSRRGGLLSACFPQRAPKGSSSAFPSSSSPDAMRRASNAPDQDEGNQSSLVVEPLQCFLHCHDPKSVSSSKPRIRTWVITADPTADPDNRLLIQLMESLNQAVYVKGKKTLVVFLSPKSGSGGAVTMWCKSILPILRYSKHAVQCIVTTRVAHCEDYVADLNNTLTSDHVVVAVGGDGMMHEAVNGLHRRHHALRAREVEQGGDGTAELSLPLLATVPAGSGCALAKSFHILKPIESALALVHLNVTRLDLMRVQFLPNAETPVPPPARVAFLNVAFAVTNEIDKGSEQWRWMGNARFTVKAASMLAKGIPVYKMKVRYRPWKHAESNEGFGKVVAQPTFDAAKSFPRCTARDDCPHCSIHRDARRRSLASPASASSSTSAAVVFPPSFDVRPNPSSTAATATAENDAKNETAATVIETKEDDDWVTMPEDEFVLLMLNNLIDAARDMELAPLAHVGDGSIDIVYTGKRADDPKRSYGRGDFLKVFLGLEEGTHIHAENVLYVKAKEVEVVPQEGLVMADGELMPTLGVRVEVLQEAVDVVRSL